MFSGLSTFQKKKSNMFTVIYGRIRSQIRKIMNSLDDLKRIDSEDSFKPQLLLEAIKQRVVNNAKIKC